jgi:hypothetical protein
VNLINGTNGKHYSGILFTRIRDRVQNSQVFKDQVSFLNLLIHWELIKRLYHQGAAWAGQLSYRKSEMSSVIPHNSGHK